MRDGLPDDGLPIAGTALGPRFGMAEIPLKPTICCSDKIYQAILVYLKSQYTTCSILYGNFLALRFEVIKKLTVSTIVILVS